MKLFINRLSIMTKRTLKQPLYISMLLILVLLTIIYIKVPDKEKSVYIPVAILNYDKNENADQMISELVSANSVFTFYPVSSESEMYDDILSGKADMGYLIPEGFFDSCTSLDTIKKIRVFVTEGTLLTSLANEVLYSHFFHYAAPLIVKDQITNSDVFENINTADLYEEVDIYYNSYLSGNEIFSVEDAVGETYTAIREDGSFQLPIRKIAGFFIFTAAMMGIAAYLTDQEHKLYFSLTFGERLSLKLIHIITSILPVSLAALICLIIIQEMSLSSLIIRLLLYMTAVTVFAFLISLLFKKSTSYYKVLPVILIFTLLFSGIFFDLSDYNHRLKAISMLFLPYYF